MVHQYADVDDKQVYTIIKHDVRDLEDYVAEVARFINRVEKYEG